MKIYNKLNKVNILFLLKTGIGSAIAILVAESLGLAFSASAGIITLLTIQNTKKETFYVAIRRILAFVLAVIISYVIFTLFGYTSFAFGGFVILFVALCYILGLKDGISINAVLATHFLIERSMDFPLIINEVFLLLIGMGIGIVLNLIMPKNKERIQREQRALEEKIKETLYNMADRLKSKKACLIQGESGIVRLNSEEFTAEIAEKVDFSHLENFLEQLLKKAYEEADNTLLADTKYLLSYLEMRKLQINILKSMMIDIERIPVLLRQTYPVADFMYHISNSFHELNNVKDLLEELDKLYEFFRKESLPLSREEFENRAILFQILKELEYFLLIKRNFILELESKNLKSYWNGKK